jgi:hypothetical protein
VTLTFALGAGCASAPGAVLAAIIAATTAILYPFMSDS